jgi:hypothetical protein
MSDQKSLFDSDEDLAAWLARMTAPPEPKTFNFQHSFAPDVQARINAQLQPPSMMPGLATQQGQQAMPQQAGVNAGLSLGPPSLNGGLSTAPTPEGGSRLQPNFGAGLKVPLPGDATGEAKFSLTPGELLQLDAEYRRKLLGGDLSVRGSYSQPTNGPPSGSAMLRWGRSF